MAAVAVIHSTIETEKKIIHRIVFKSSGSDPLFQWSLKNIPTRFLCGVWQ